MINVILFCFKIKYHELYNKNGQSYILGPDGFQYTRDWMNKLNGIELTNAIFSFAQNLRELHLSENEFSLIIPLHMCYDGKILLISSLSYFDLYSFRIDYGRSRNYSNATFLLPLCAVL